MLKPLLQLALTGVILSFSSFSSAAFCVPTDVTWNGNAADDCEGPSDGNDTGRGPQNTFNDTLPDDGLWAGEGFTLLTKSDSNPPKTENSIGGVDFLISTSGGTNGEWTLRWTEKVAGSLPITLDLIASVKGSNAYTLFLFKDLTFLTVPFSGTGTFSTQSLRTGGDQTPNLSHMSIFGRIAITEEVPEPATVALLGLGLIGIGFRRRFMKS
jgi:hypothetical protein